MQKITVLAAVALIGVLAQGCASDQRAESNLHVGKIQSVYVEEYKGVFVDQAVVGSGSGKPLWVYVTFAQPLADGRISRQRCSPRIPESSLVTWSSCR